MMDHTLKLNIFTAYSFVFQFVEMCFVSD
nr:daz associated protein 1 [Hymenolepis microstoma]